MIERGLPHFFLDNAGNAARLVDQRRGGHAISEAGRLVPLGGTPHVSRFHSVCRAIFTFERG